MCLTFKFVIGLGIRRDVSEYTRRFPIVVADKPNLCILETGSYGDPSTIGTALKICRYAFTELQWYLQVVTSIVADSARGASQVALDDLHVEEMIWQRVEKYIAGHVGTVERVMGCVLDWRLEE